MRPDDRDARVPDACDQRAGRLRAHRRVFCPASGCRASGRRDVARVIAQLDSAFCLEADEIAGFDPDTGVGPRLTSIDDDQLARRADALEIVGARELTTRQDAVAVDVELI